LAQRLAGEPFQDTCSQAEEFPVGYSDGPRLPGSQWRVHDEKRPRSPIVTSAAAEQPGKPPSDAVVLFDGTDLKEWVSAKDGTAAKWKIENGALQVVAGAGDIVTKESFGDSQLHIEFATPALTINQSQGRGNSGVFLHGLYEVQILDGSQNPTYADGEATAIFGQTPPLANASRAPGVHGGYQDWLERPGRFRSLGDGQVDFNGVFAKFAQYDYPGWAVVEWECCLKHPEDGAKQGAEFVRDHIIRVTGHSFDNFAGGNSSRELNRRVLGL
jgi:hypothetical protein